MPCFLVGIIKGRGLGYPPLAGLVRGCPCYALFLGVLCHALFLGVFNVSYFATGAELHFYMDA